MVIPPKKILIVDDNPEDRYTYNRYLQQDAIDTYQIIEAETGEEGLDLFYHKAPDLILLDFNLPDIDGLEFIAQLKLNNDFLPPIIMLTGEGNEAIAVKAMKAGVKDYLIKDQTNRESFSFAVRNVLEQARLQRLVQRNEERFHISVESMLDCFGIYTSIRDENNTIIGFRGDYLNESARQNNLFDWQDKTVSNICSFNILHSQADLFSLCCQVIEYSNRPLAQIKLKLDIGYSLLTTHYLSNSFKTNFIINFFIRFYLIFVLILRYLINYSYLIANNP